MKDAIIIDSSSTNRDVLASQLRSLWPCTLTTLNTIEEAWEKLSKSKSAPEIIFVSLTDGFGAMADFLMNLRARHKSVAVIAMVSNVTLADMRALLQVGVDQILIRPLTTNTIKEKVGAAKSFRYTVQQENLAIPNDSYFESRMEQVTDKIHKVTLIGWMAENVELPEVVPTEPGTTLFVDFDQLRGMNSVGIRMWLMWIKSVRENGYSKIEMEHLRTFFLQQAAAVRGLIPDNSVVNSFYMLYFNADRNEERDFLISREKHYPADKMMIPKLQSLEIDGKKVIYELDDVTTKAKTFFNGSISVVA